MGKYTKVRRRKYSIGKTCMQCRKTVTITAVYKSDPRHMLEVWYCDEHAQERGII